MSRRAPATPSALLVTSPLLQLACAFQARTSIYTGTSTLFQYFVAISPPRISLGQMRAWELPLNHSSNKSKPNGSLGASLESIATVLVLSAAAC